MNIIKTAGSLAFIIGLNYICHVAAKALDINFPPPLIAMILLSILMYFKIIPLDFVEKGAKPLLDHIALFFVALIVGSFAYMVLIKDKIIILFEIFAVTSILLIVVTGIVTQYLLARRICKKRLRK